MTNQFGSLRLNGEPQEGKDYTGPQTVIDSEGYKWHFSPNQTKVLPDDGNRTTLAGNATVDWGAATQQLDAPEVQADIDDQPART